MPDCGKTSNSITGGCEKKGVRRDEARILRKVEARSRLARNVEEEVLVKYNVPRARWHKYVGRGELVEDNLSS